MNKESLVNHDWSCGHRSVNRLTQRLKIRHLQIFREAMESGSFLKASHRLGLTQPAISRAIREMEVLVGSALVVRSHEGVRPTECGAALLSHANYVLAHIHAFSDEVDALVLGESGRIIVGTILNAEEQLLADAISELARTMVNLLVTVRPAPCCELMASLSKAELDMVIGNLPNEEYQRIKKEVLFQEKLVIVTGPHSRLAKRNFRSLADLQKYHWIVPPRGSPVGRILEEAFRREGLAVPEKRIECASIVTNLRLLTAHDEIVAMLPERVACDCIQNRQIALLPVKGMRAVTSVGVALNADRQPTPAAERLLKIVRELAHLRCYDDPPSISGLVTATSAA